jgi:hypothetical protein
MLYALLALTGLSAVIVYVLVIFREVPGAVSERWGDLEELPDDLGQWRADTSSQAALDAEARGQLREVRTWLERGGGRFGRDRLLLQTRYKSRATGKVERSDPDTVIKRKRTKT